MTNQSFALQSVVATRENADGTITRIDITSEFELTGNNELKLKDGHWLELSAGQGLSDFNLEARVVARGQVGETTLSKAPSGGDRWGRLPGGMKAKFEFLPTEFTIHINPTEEQASVLFKESIEIQREYGESSRDLNAPLHGRVFPRERRVRKARKFGEDTVYYIERETRNERLNLTVAGTFVTTGPGQPVVTFSDPEVLFEEKVNNARAADDAHYSKRESIELAPDAFSWGSELKGGERQFLDDHFALDARTGTITQKGDISLSDPLFHSRKLSVDVKTKLGATANFTFTLNEGTFDLAGSGSEGDQTLTAGELRDDFYSAYEDAPISQLLEGPKLGGGAVRGGSPVILGQGESALTLNHDSLMLFQGNVWHETSQVAINKEALVAYGYTDAQADQIINAYTAQQLGNVADGYVDPKAAGLPSLTQVFLGIDENGQVDPKAQEAYIKMLRDVNFRAIEGTFGAGADPVALANQLVDSYFTGAIGDNIEASLEASGFEVGSQKYEDLANTLTQELVGLIQSLDRSVGAEFASFLAQEESLDSIIGTGAAYDETFAGFSLDDPLTKVEAGENLGFALMVADLQSGNPDTVYTHVRTLLDEQGIDLSDDAAVTGWLASLSDADLEAAITDILGGALGTLQTGDLDINRIRSATGFRSLVSEVYQTVGAKFVHAAAQNPATVAQFLQTGTPTVSGTLNSLQSAFGNQRLGQQFRHLRFLNLRSPICTLPSRSCTPLPGENVVLSALDGDPDAARELAESITLIGSFQNIAFGFDRSIKALSTTGWLDFAADAHADLTLDTSNGQPQLVVAGRSDLAEALNISGDATGTRQTGTITAEMAAAIAARIAQNGTAVGDTITTPDGQTIIVTQEIEALYLGAESGGPGTGVVRLTGLEYDNVVGIDHPVNQTGPLGQATADEIAATIDEHGDDAVGRTVTSPDVSAETHAFVVSDGNIPYPAPTYEQLQSMDDYSAIATLILLDDDDAANLLNQWAQDDPESVNAALNELSDESIVRLFHLADSTLRTALIYNTGRGDLAAQYAADLTIPDQTDFADGLLSLADADPDAAAGRSFVAGYWEEFLEPRSYAAIAPEVLATYADPTENIVKIFNRTAVEADKNNILQDLNHSDYGFTAEEQEQIIAFLSDELDQKLGTKVPVDGEEVPWNTHNEKLIANLAHNRLGNSGDIGTLVGPETRGVMNEYQRVFIQTLRDIGEYDTLPVDGLRTLGEVSGKDFSERFLKKFAENWNNHVGTTDFKLNLTLTPLHAAGGGSFAQKGNTVDINSNRNYSKIDFINLLSHEAFHAVQTHAGKSQPTSTFGLLKRISRADFDTADDYRIHYRIRQHEIQSFEVQSRVIGQLADDNTNLLATFQKKAPGSDGRLSSVAIIPSSIAPGGQQTVGGRAVPVPDFINTLIDGDIQAKIAKIIKTKVKQRTASEKILFEKYNTYRENPSHSSANDLLLEYFTGKAGPVDAAQTWVSSLTPSEYSFFSGLNIGNIDNFRKFDQLSNVLPSAPSGLPLFETLSGEELNDAKKARETLFKIAHETAFKKDGSLTNRPAQIDRAKVDFRDPSSVIGYLREVSVSPPGFRLLKEWMKDAGNAADFRSLVATVDALDFFDHGAKESIIRIQQYLSQETPPTFSGPRGFSEENVDGNPRKVVITPEMLEEYRRTGTVEGQIFETNTPNTARTQRQGRWDLFKDEFGGKEFAAARDAFARLRQGDIPTKVDELGRTVPDWLVRWGVRAGAVGSGLKGLFRAVGTLSPIADIALVAWTASEAFKNGDKQDKLLAHLDIATVILDVTAATLFLAGVGAPVGSGLAVAAAAAGPIGWIALGLSAVVFVAGIIKSKDDGDPIVEMARPLAEFLTQFGGVEGGELVNLLQGENVSFRAGETDWDGKVLYDQGTNRLIIGGGDITEALAEVFAEALKSPEENSWLLNLFHFFEYQQQAESTWEGVIDWPDEQEAPLAA